MSGGSFTYICRAELEALARDVRLQEMIGCMARSLAGYGASDAAEETDEVLRLLKSLPDDQKTLLAEGEALATPEADEIESRLWRLQPLWEAIEWCCSLDCTETDVRKAIQVYRARRSRRAAAPVLVEA